MLRSAADSKKRVRDWSGPRRIVWLASYPRSGNTWTRALLANLLSTKDKPVSVDHIADFADLHAARRETFDDWTGVASADCTGVEVDLLRPAFYRFRAAQAKDAGKPFFARVHDAFHRNRAGEWLFPDDATAGAVYILRNPLDVAVSCKFYIGEGYADSVARLNKPRASLNGKGFPQVRQRLMDWSSHVRSWTTAASFPVLTVRYEQLLADTVSQLRKIAHFLRLNEAEDESRLRRAVAFSDFTRLRGNEEREGFREHAVGRQPFFRFGKADDWRTHLNAKQVREILRVHGETMAAFGYGLDGRNGTQPLGDETGWPT